MSLRLAINIIRKDWFEYGKVVLLLTAAMFLPLLFSRFSGSSREFSRGMIMGLLVSAAYSYAYSCFMIERQRGTLPLLLGLPVRSFDLVIAKYAALYSMVLCTANIPGVFLRDLLMLFLLNSFVLLLSTVAMAATVVSEQPWAPMIPVWIVLILLVPLHRIIERLYPDGLEIYAFVTMNITLFGWVALALCPVIAVLSALYFERKLANVE